MTSLRVSLWRAVIIVDRIDWLTASNQYEVGTLVRLRVQLLFRFSSFFFSSFSFGFWRDWFIMLWFIARRGAVLPSYFASVRSGRPLFLCVAGVIFWREFFWLLEISSCCPGHEANMRPTLPCSDAGLYYRNRKPDLVCSEIGDSWKLKGCTRNQPSTCCQQRTCVRNGACHSVNRPVIEKKKCFGERTRENGTCFENGDILHRTSSSY